MVMARAVSAIAGKEAGHQVQSEYDNALCPGNGRRRLHGHSGAYVTRVMGTSCDRFRASAAGSRTLSARAYEKGSQPPFVPRAPDYLSPIAVDGAASLNQAMRIEPRVARRLRGDWLMRLARRGRSGTSSHYRPLPMNPLQVNLAWRSSTNQL